MKQSTFVKLGLATFGLVGLTFVVRGTTRLIVGERVSMLLSAPFGLTALVLVVALFAIAVLAASGLRPLDPDLEER